jgi:hypothetical protein
MKRRPPASSQVIVNPNWRSASIEPDQIRRKPKAPASSWWTERDFSAAYEREKPRLLRTDTTRVIHPEDPRA